MAFTMGYMVIEVSSLYATLTTARSRRAPGQRVLFGGRQPDGGDRGVPLRKVRRHRPIPDVMLDLDRATEGSRRCDRVAACRGRRWRGSRRGRPRSHRKVIAGFGLVDGELVLLAESDAEFADAAMLALVDDPERRANLGTSARARTLEHVDSRPSTSLDDRYRRLLGAAGS